MLWSVFGWHRNCTLLTISERILSLIDDVIVFHSADVGDVRQNALIIDYLANIRKRDV